MLKTTRREVRRGLYWSFVLQDARDTLAGNAGLDVAAELERVLPKLVAMIGKNAGPDITRELILQSILQPPHIELAHMAIECGASPDVLGDFMAVGVDLDTAGLLDRA